MQIFAIVLSFALTVAAVALLVPAVRRMLGVIRSGQPAPGRSDNPAGRTVTMLKETFLHTRMLQWHWVGIMHWFVYAAFLFLSTAVLAAYFQLFKPDFAWPIIGHWYPYEWFSELIGLLSTVGIVFLIVYRQKHHPRSEGRSSRFFGSTFWQAYFVEALALLEGSAILFVRARRVEARRGGRPRRTTRSRRGSATRSTRSTPASLENLIYAIAAFKIALAMIWLMVIARNITMGIAWHRFTAWFNIWFKREPDGSTALGAMKPLTSDGKAITLDDIDDLDEDSVLGVGKVEDFSWKGILDFTTCTECGRCQSQCPAWNTEKPLSPKLLITGLRDHAYAKHDGVEAHAERELVGVGSKGESAGAGTDVLDYFYNPADGDFVIDEDVLWSCTSCGACVQQCPVDIEHVDHIMDMRRYQLLVESNFPAELNQLFKGLENKGNPWNMSATARMDWAKGLRVRRPGRRRGPRVPRVGRLAVLGRLRGGVRGPRQEDDARGRRAARHGRDLLRRAGQRRDLHRRPGPSRRQRVRLPGPGPAERRDVQGVQGQEGRLDLRPLLQHAQERVQGLRHRARGRAPHAAAQPPRARGQADARSRTAPAPRSARSPTTTRATSAATTRSTRRRASCSRSCPGAEFVEMERNSERPSAAAPVARACGWRRTSASGSTSTAPGRPSAPAPTRSPSAAPSAA